MGLKELIFGGGTTAHKGHGAYGGSVQDWLPVENIVQGVVVLKDGRCVKVLEVLPINLYTLSELEKENVVADFAAYLKIAPATLQMTVITQKFDLEAYKARQQERMAQEQNGQCRAMIEDNVSEVARVLESEAITHRFFLSFEYEPRMKARDNSVGAMAERLNAEASSARRYLGRCGLEVLEPEYADNAILELLYELVNKSTSKRVKLPSGVFDMLTTVHGVYQEDALIQPETATAVKRRFRFKKRRDPEPFSLEAGATTVQDVLSPTVVDRTIADCILVDGVFHAYLYVAGYGYATVVGKGWLTPLIEAGEGVSLTVIAKKQSRDKAVSDISQKTMINRSRMREVGDTRQDYEELGDAISAGLYLKNGMSREGEDMYYMHTLIEVTAEDMDTLEQRLSAVETLCVSIDMLAKRCTFKEEQGFLSLLPILKLDPDVERKARRNALTSGVAAAFPFASYELSDRDGVFLGLNLYNRSPVFLNFFDDYKYTNGNMAIFGSSGAGKTFTLQCVGGGCGSMGAE